MENIDLKITVDNKPLMFFIKVLKRLLQTGKCSIDFGHLRSEIARLEIDNSSATANELNIVLYPSDTLLRLVSTIGAIDFDFHIIEHASHKKPPPNR